MSSANFIRLVHRFTNSETDIAPPAMDSEIGQLMLNSSPSQIASQLQSDGYEYTRVWSYLTYVACEMSKFLAILEWTALSRVNEKYVIIPLKEGEIKLCLEEFCELSRIMFKEIHRVIVDHPQLRMGEDEAIQYRMLNAAVGWAHLAPICAHELLEGLCKELVTDHGEFFLTVLELYNESNQTLASMKKYSPYN